VNWKNQFNLNEVKLKEKAEIDRMKSRFFANISHEFRTPLTLIIGPIEKIKPNITAEEIQKQTGLIKRNVGSLLSLVNQLLDLSKLEAGKLTLNALSGNIVSFVKGLVLCFESVAYHKDISLKVKASNNDIQLYFDRDKMEKILTNLLSNAFKFTPEGGKIAIHITQTEQNSVEIKIRDTGIGISEDELPKLFDRFYQVDSSQTREHEGTGLGLALTKDLVELHHGGISVKSKQGDPDLSGTGWTEFTIVLPSGRDHLNDDEILHQQTSEKEIVFSETKDLAQMESPISDEDELMDIDNTLINGKSELVEFVVEDKILILVVEDHRDVRDYIKDSLGDNFNFSEASNGEEGVRTAQKLIPDLIISDIMMPKTDGHELTRTLKNDEKTSHIPIILLTAKFEQESKLEGLETGADDYLTKPFDSKELQIRVKNLIDNRKKLREKFGRGEYIPKTAGKKFTNLEERFMSKIVEVIENHLSEEEFSIEQLAAEMYMSRMQLHRKLKALTGKSSSLYIRSFRLLRARKMIQDQQGNISEIAYSVGFSSPAYFTKCFKNEFGSPPSEFSG
jgi:DNA-binding response OmpR family regulator/nitrogen-specific signal transduction histidine kinase